MRRKRVRFGIKWIDGKFIELASIRPHGDGYVLFTPDSDRHIMTLKEADAISSHIKNQVTGEYTPLGRLHFKDVDIDEELARLGNLRKLDESEYGQTLFYQNPEFWDVLLTTEFEMVTEEKKRDILKYIDLAKFFGDARERVEWLWVNKVMPFLTCHASDLFDREDIEAGITENQLAVFEYEGELYEMNPLYLYDFSSPEHPWAEFLRPLGIMELMGEIDIDERIKDV